MRVNRVYTKVFLLLAALILTACSAPASRTTTEREAAQKKNIDIQEWYTGNGVRVLFVEARELPMLDIEVTFDAGSVRDGRQPGIAKMTNSMLSHGARLGKKVLTVEDIAERFDSIGAEFSTSAGKDNASISLRSLTDKKWLAKAIQTMQAIINAPTFDARELERIRKQWLAAFESRKQSPATIANELFYKKLYGKHPYARPSIGTVKSVKKIRRADLRAFYKKYYVARNALVTIVGDVNRAQAMQLAEQLAGKLAQGKKAAALAKVKPLKKAMQLHIDFPSTQTHILMGEPGVDRRDRDYFTLYVANHILGGSGFGSRIMKEIREKRGLAYSSYSYFLPMRRKGPFLMGMQTRNSKAGEALEVLRQTLKHYIEQGPTAEELEHAKKNITGGFPLKVDSNSDIAGYIAMIGFYQLPLDYLQNFNRNIEAVTLEQIRDALKRRIHPDKMLTVTVGKSTN